MVSQTEKEFVYKNSIYFALIVYRQEYRNELSVIKYVSPRALTIILKS
jgi:hypothetical protein